MGLSSSEMREMTQDSFIILEKVKAVTTGYTAGATIAALSAALASILAQCPREARDNFLAMIINTMYQAMEKGNDH